MTMATMTIVKSSEPNKPNRYSAVLEHHPPLGPHHKYHQPTVLSPSQAPNQQPQPHTHPQHPYIGSSLSFPYVSYNGKKALSQHDSSEPPFILSKQSNHNHILRSSSLYDNSNNKSTHSPFDPNSSVAPAAAMMLAKQPPVINSLLPRVEIAKVQSRTATAAAAQAQAEGSNKSVSNRENLENRTRRLLDKLTHEEVQHLSRLLYKHFYTRRNALQQQQQALDPPIPVDYNEEDPQTWPSNWLSQAPAMILEPDTYLAAKPSLNAYQRQLIRRISLKYEPLVAQLLQQLMAHRVVVTSQNHQQQNRLASAGEDIAERGNSSSLRLGKSSSSKSQHHTSSSSSSSMVKSASLSSSLSSQSRIGDPINSTNSVGSSSNNNPTSLLIDNNGGAELLSYCHKDAGTLLSSTGIKPDHGATAGGSRANGGKSIDDNNNTGPGRHSKGSAQCTPTTSSSCPETPLVSSSRSSPKLSEQNRLTRLSAMHLNKWSSKMKIYLRKN